MNQQRRQKVPSRTSGEARTTRRTRGNTDMQHNNGGTQEDERTCCSRGRISSACRREIEQDNTGMHGARHKHGSTPSARRHERVECAPAAAGGLVPISCKRGGTTTKDLSTGASTEKQAGTRKTYLGQE
jgi:hypothetical protein